MFGRKKDTTRVVKQQPRAAQPPPPPTQDHLHVRGVLPGGYVLADDGVMAAGIIVNPVDLALAGAHQMQAVHDQFTAFMASLDHNTPIQVVIASLPQRCQEYRDRIVGRVQRYTNLADEAHRQGDEEQEARFRHMSDVAAYHLTLVELILDELRPREEMYLVMAYHNPFPVLSGVREISPEQLEEGKKEIDRRLTRVQGQLAHYGMTSRRATADDLTIAFYSFYHMSTDPLGRALQPQIAASAISDESFNTGEGE